MTVLADVASLTKPKITLLNIGSAVSCFFLAGGGPEGAALLFLVGYLASGGASALNNYLDRDLDGLMKRTAGRPLPRGRVPARLALTLGLLFSASSVALAASVFNPLTALMIVGGIVSYVVVYTILLKRRTEWNIVIGGVAGSFPPLAGWAAASGSIGLPAVLVALLVFLWTPGHFWALALRAERDYRSAQLPMLPATRGADYAVKAIAASNALMLLGWAALSLVMSLPMLFLMVTAPLTALIAYYTAALSLRRRREDSWRLFKASSPWLLFVQIGVSLARVA
ncbi:MAG: heme o synthase [Nitrososphaerota archaeon]|nr:heme o synthase [Candidatus Calditenuaceae archaeon]MDW8073894.1 heme o synthase [Nitrososphaerota archaeon]